MISKYFKFIKESQTVILDDGNGNNKIEARKYGRGSIAELNQVIKNYVESVYGPYGFVYGVNKDLDINGMVINSEYISKMVNNYTVFKSVIRLNNIKDSESLFNFVKNNLDDIYSYEGNHFKTNTLPILINTTRRGNIGEKNSKEAFVDYAKSKDINITMVDPTVEEDIKGIDFKFIINNKVYTGQVKPFTKYGKTDSGIKVKSNGSLSLNTDYLVLFRDNDFIILKNPSNNKIEIRGDIFQTSNSNVLRIT